MLYKIRYTKVNEISFDTSTLFISFGRTRSGNNQIN